MAGIAQQVISVAGRVIDIIVVHAAQAPSAAPIYELVAVLELIAT